jgi:homoserine kinase
MQKVTIRVPASTSNLGPGFDCLGVALRLYNFVTVSRGESLPRQLLIGAVANLFWRRTKRKRFPFAVSIKGDVPQCRGLGGSATVCLGVLHGLNELSNAGLTRRQLFEIAATLEGHPDNAAPAEFGGFNVNRAGEPQRFKVSSQLQFVLLIPEFEVATKSARRLLPTRIPHSHAVASTRAACAITAAFASRRYENLRGAFVDYLHQPYRKKLVPLLDRVISAGEKAGALGGFLSGSGSSVICVTLKDADNVARAMKGAWRLTNARTIVTRADNFGAQLVTRPPRRSQAKAGDRALVTSHGHLA